MMTRDQLREFSRTERLTRIAMHLSDTAMREVAERVAAELPDAEQRALFAARVAQAALFFKLALWQAAGRT